MSLFDGISCGRLALEKVGINANLYYAFEIDKYAQSISRYNYPDNIHCGDVLNADFNSLKGADLVIGGSPCTFWSIAKNNREVDKNGFGWKLFMRYVDAVRSIKPKWFLYENVASMPNQIKTHISEELQTEPILINSALVSAQQRKRLYWTNIPVSQPKDKGILLQHILESGITSRDKSVCLDACYYKGGNHSSLGKQSAKRLMVYDPFPLNDKAKTIPTTIYNEKVLSMFMKNKAGLFCGQEVLKNYFDMKNNTCREGHQPLGAALRTRADEAGRFKRLEVRKDGKLNALTTVLTDSVVCEPIRLGSIGNGGQGERIYSVKGKTVSISANGGGGGAKTGLYKVDLPDGNYLVRKLTPIEAERCQTIYDNYTAFGTDDNGKKVKISNTQRYKCIGNAWTVDVIAHILSSINEKILLHQTAT